MRQVDVRLLEPGDVLAEPIVNQYGMTMLGAGTALTENLIALLKKLGIQTAIVRNKELDGSFQEVDVKKQSSMLKFQDLKEKREARKEIRQMLVRLADSDLGLGRLSTPHVDEQFRRMFCNILYDITSHEQVLDGLIRLQQNDPYLLDHSFHVTAYSAILGIAGQYSGAEMIDLCVGALLFDIGMTELPSHIIRRPGSLTGADREALRRHPEAGFQIMCEMEGVSRRSALCALQHHERYNGTGYPSRLKHHEIDEYAQIVAIADTYHALISRRNYRLAYTPGEAIEYLLAAGDRYFSLELIQKYLRHISIYPLSSIVKLSSGQLGVVTSLDSNLVHRPTVKIIREADGSEVKSPYEIDLMRKTDLVITEIMENDEAGLQLSARA